MRWIEMRLVQRDRYRERAASAHLAFNADGSAVQPYELAHQCKPDARALLGTAARAIDAVKALEDARQFLGRNAYAGILNDKIRHVADRGQTHRDPAHQRELEGVGEQVEHNLLPHVAINKGRGGPGRRRRALDLERQPRTLASRAKVARQL